MMSAADNSQSLGQGKAVQIKATSAALKRGASILAAADSRAKALLAA